MLPWFWDVNGNPMSKCFSEVAPMKKRRVLQMNCVVLVFCAAMAIAAPAQVLTTLHSFDGSDGESLYAGLIQATDGNFYGTTGQGGAYYNGSVFKITPSGTLTTLYSFCSQTNCVDGSGPLAGLVQASNGNFYGTTEFGGTSGNCSNGCGTIFRITPSGTLTVFHSFDNADGATPFAGLMQAADGNFYGTTYGGGVDGYGTVFKITPSGTLTTLHGFRGPDGNRPVAGLIQATDGNFYGTTLVGGAYGAFGYGTVFKLTPSGTLTTLYSFCTQPGCADGWNPHAGVIQATDGDFYGTTDGAGAYGDGTVFKITPNGTLTTVHSFDGTDGASSWAGLVQATDGNFYGTTSTGGTYNDYCRYGCGTVFKITPSGTLTTLHSFNYADGYMPLAGLVQATDGNFYGTTYGGGSYGAGAVFRLVLPHPCIVCRTAE